MGISRSVSNTLLSIFTFVVLSACNTANREAAMTMVVQTFEARGTGTVESAAATQMGATEIVLAEIAEATDIAQAEIAEGTAIALTEAAKATATPTLTPTASPTPTVDPQDITYLADLKPIYISAYTNDCCPPFFWVRQIGYYPYDSKPTGDPLVGINNTLYENGIYIKAGSRNNQGDFYWENPSILVYLLNGEYASFRSTLTLFKSGGNCEGAIFSVDLDNEIVYESPAIYNRGPAIDINIDITGVNRLKLHTSMATNPAPYEGSCGPIWGDPYLVNADTDTTKPSTAITDTPEPIIAVTNTPATTITSIQGRVYWASTGDPVEGVVLGLGGTEVSSDAEGKYMFAGLAPGSYSFTLRWEFDFDGGDTPCAGLDPTTMIAGDWFTNFVTLNAGGNMVVAIQNDGVEVKAGESTTFDIVFTCSD